LARPGKREKGKSHRGRGPDAFGEKGGLRLLSLKKGEKGGMKKREALGEIAREGKEEGEED